MKQKQFNTPTVVTKELVMNSQFCRFTYPAFTFIIYPDVLPETETETDLLNTT